MSNPLPSFQHIVVLMFENRSFDHIFGGFTQLNGVRVDGLYQPDGLTLKPEVYNLPDPTQPPGPSNAQIYPQPIGLGPSGVSQLAHDFNHDFGDGMVPDFFGPYVGLPGGTTGYTDATGPIGAPSITYPPSNSGFYSTIAWNADPTGQTPNGADALNFFQPGSLQVLHPLAQNFVLCDRWFCDMPGHTEPNRAFFHCATTGAVGIDDNDGGMVGEPTLFQLIDTQLGGIEPNLRWKMYAAAGAQRDVTFLNLAVAADSRSQATLDDFASDVQGGTLPYYSFLMCWQANATVETDTSMHPASDIRAGENYLAAVYNTLRASPTLWPDTLLVITFDENGGMYDHVSPPSTVPPAPATASGYQVSTGTTNSGLASQFDFSLLGPRLPAILVSPWLAAGRVAQQPCQNTSVARFVEDLLNVPADQSLTLRDAAAPSLTPVLAQFALPALRPDCPLTLPSYPGYPYSTGILADDPAGTARRAQLLPMPHMVEVAKKYINGLPGHPDSGRKFDWNFATYADLNRYIATRLKAAGLG